MDSRKLSIKKILNNKVKREPQNKNSSENFGKKSFTINSELAKKIINKKYSNSDISNITLEIKKWALKNNATHYTHWFYPLRGSTAEKHDSFINFKGADVIEELNFNELLKQEPDASSFPSGGMRSTFESRGYTIWDPSSPLFILNDTLCIPTFFISYNGKILDFKTPLIKSNNLLDKNATKICQYFDKKINSVESTLGWEQEFFVIDRGLYLARPDIILSDRTLFGHASAKDQQLSNNYLGSMPNRIRKFLKDVEKYSYELGIPLKTRHNEVAPQQFEIAPIYEEMNVAVDHNIQLMNILDGVSEKHNLKVLFHEKPFAGINGSGKHNNWSMRTNNGDNLLTPGKKPEEKLRFVTFLVTILKAISKYPNLLRASVATPENEHRLGGHEAPPAIISVFIGEQLTKILDNFEKTGDINVDDKNGNIKIPIIPDIFVDNTDRNRTSPFAFTGNKFEFRAPGSSVNCAKPMTIINMIVADQLNELYNEVENGIKEIEFDEIIFSNTIHKVLKKVLLRYIEESKYIRFEGDGYSEKWFKEAESRGLKNVKLTPDVLKFYVENDIVNLYERNGILTKEEIVSRYEIKLEKYIKKIQIEGRVIGDIARNHILPAAIKYQNIIQENKSYQKPTQPSNPSTYTGRVFKELEERINNLDSLVFSMVKERKIANNMDNIVDMAEHYSKIVFPYFDKIRYEADKLELIVDDTLWTLPKYRELLFLL